MRQFYLEGYDPLHAHAEDTPDKVDANVLAESFELARFVVQNMDRML